MRTQPLILALAMLGLAGCANDPAPNEQMRLSEQARSRPRPSVPPSRWRN